MSKYVITCKLPSLSNTSVYEKNYFCGFKHIPTEKFVGLRAIEWDTDKKYSLKFHSRYLAKKVLSQIETGEPLEIEILQNQTNENY